MTVMTDLAFGDDDNERGSKPLADFLMAIAVIDSDCKGRLLMRLLAEHNVFLCDHIVVAMPLLNLYNATNDLVDMLYDEWFEYVKTNWSLHYC